MTRWVWKWWLNHPSRIGLCPPPSHMDRDTLMGDREFTYHVHTTPDLVRAKENWAPHSIWHTPCPFSLSMFWGMLQPSLPPRPNFPKSPSPQENTKPRFKKYILQASIHSAPTHPEIESGSSSPSSVRARVCASLLPHATWITLWPRRTLTYSIKNLKTESTTGTEKTREIFPTDRKPIMHMSLWNFLDSKIIFSWNQQMVSFL